MEFDEFLKIVNKSVEGLDWVYQGDSFNVENGWIIQRHEVGGAKGGSCYGDYAEPYSTDRSAEAFKPLDTILTQTKPDISYLGYKAIEALIEQDREEDREYYGNYTIYEIYKLDIEKLYDKIFG